MTSRSRKIRRVTFIGILAVFAAACSGITKPTPPPSIPDQDTPPAPPSPAPITPISPRTFIGQDPAILEARTGEPSFTRTEGENRFHRYDLKGCRLYVIILRGADGTRQISHIETGTRDSNDPAPSFSNCLQNLGG